MTKQIVMLRRAAYIRELASLGCFQSQIADLLGVEKGQIHRTTRRYGIRVPGYRPTETDLQRQVREGYALQLAPAVIAERNGRSYAAVRTMASRMGVSRHQQHDTFKNRRGFAIPDDKRSDYREFRRLGLTIHECGVNLGLIDRNAVEVRQ